MQFRILSLLILVSSLIPYLSWGKTNHTFLFQAEWLVLNKLTSTPSEVMHPLIIVPLLSQFLIVIFGIIFPKTHMVYLGILGLYILIAFILFAGFLSGNIWIVLSCAPFIVCSTLFILFAKKE